MRRRIICIIWCWCSAFWIICKGVAEEEDEEEGVEEGKKEPDGEILRMSVHWLLYYESTKYNLVGNTTRTQAHECFTTS